MIKIFRSRVVFFSDFLPAGVRRMKTDNTAIYLGVCIHLDKCWVVMGKDWKDQQFSVLERKVNESTIELLKRINVPKNLSSVYCVLTCSRNASDNERQALADAVKSVGWKLERIYPQDTAALIGSGYLNKTLPEHHVWVQFEGGELTHLFVEDSVVGLSDVKDAKEQPHDIKFIIRENQPQVVNPERDLSFWTVATGAFHMAMVLHGALFDVGKRAV